MRTFTQLHTLKEVCKPGRVSAQSVTLNLLAPGFYI